MRRKPVGLALLVAALIACSVFSAVIAIRNYHSAQQDFYPAPQSELSLHPEQTNVRGLINVAFLTQQGQRICGWYVPSKNHAAIILTTGTNNDRSELLAEIRVLTTAGFAVLAFDWPGSGASSGEIHWSDGERQALVAAIDWLSTQSGIDPHRIGALGLSMGGYITAQVAAKDTRLSAVVLAAAPADFMEYITWTHNHWGWLSMSPAKFAVRRASNALSDIQPLNDVANISPRPLLIIGGALDTTVPVSMALELFRAAKQPKSLWIIPAARHLGYMQIAPVEYSYRLIEFFTHGLAAPELT